MRGDSEAKVQVRRSRKRKGGKGAKKDGGEGEGNTEDLLKN